MKKSLKVISVLLAASLVLGAFVGCKKEASASVEKVKKWGDTNINGGLGLLRIQAEKPINWWVITDMNGEVLDPTDDKFEVAKLPTGADPTQKLKPTEKTTAFNYRAEIPAGAVIELKFDTKKWDKQTDVIVWTNINDTKEVDFGGKKTPLNTLTSRGRIDVTPNSGRLIKTSGCPEYVIPMGTVKITCDEDNRTGRWHGKYNITEFWPITKSDTTGKYVAVDDLKITGIDIPQSGKTGEFICPQSAEYIAIKQPNRFDPSKASDTEKYVGAREDYMAKKYTEKQAEEQAAKDQAEQYWCGKVSVKMNETTSNIKSSTFTTYFVPKLGKIYEGSTGNEIAATAVPNPIIYIDEADFLTGDEK